jgi:prevent-host-death family protein
MTEVGIYAAKTRFAELIKLVAAGEAVVITNRSKPVVELVLPKERSGQDLEALISSIKTSRAGEINRKLFDELKLALRLNLPLATLDTDLRKAAKKAGIGVYLL